MINRKSQNLLRGVLSTLLLSLLLFSCSMDGRTGTNEETFVQAAEKDSSITVNGEVFEMANYPDFTKVTEIINGNGVNDLAEMNADGRVSYLSQPWNYEKAENQSRTYPLVIYLHASASTHNLNWYLSSYLGNGTRREAQQFKSSYPAFIYFPFASNLFNFDADYDKLIGDIQTLISKRRIDPNRIYLIGYENGSDAVVELTRRYNNDTRGIAGVVRVSGRKALSLTEDVQKAFVNTSIWMNNANGERPQNQALAREGFGLFRDYYSTNGSYTSTTTVAKMMANWILQDVSYSTETITVNGIERAKISSYGNAENPMTYETLLYLPYQNPELFKWLFNQRRVKPKTDQEHLYPKTVTHKVNGRTFHTRIPSNYEKPENLNKTYPLLIFLHGSTSTPRLDWHLPYFWADGRGFIKDYPHYLYFPFATLGNTYAPDLDAMIGDIENLIQNERIDPSRIYVVGYSLGSSTTVDLARRYYTINPDRGFAAVVKMSGTRPHTLEDDVKKALSRSSLWIHSGYDDNLHGQVNVARASMQLFRDYYTTAANSTVNSQSPYFLDGSIYDVTGITETISVDGDPRFKWTLYGEQNVIPSIHHGRIAVMPYQNPDFYPWLFSRRLK